MDKVYDYAIVGNGLLGIHLGHYLKKNNQNYIILEKSKNVGGRFSSRRFEKFNFNFGIRSFKWDGDFFKKEIEKGLKDGDLFIENEEVYPKDTFNVWTKKLAEKLNVRQFHVQNIKANEFFEMNSGNEKIFTKKLIITIPARQAYSLFEDAKYNYLLDVEYTKEMYYMCQSPSSNLCLDSLELIYKKKIKEEYYYYFKIRGWNEADRDKIKESIDKKLLINHSFAHKWRYCRVKKTIDYKIQGDNLFFLGDYYNGDLKGSYSSSEFFKKSFKETML